MFRNTSKLLNIKQGEVKLVRFLFLIQFLLGAGIAFFSTCGLTHFLSTFEVTVLPTVYLAAGACLLLFNFGYARVEPRFAPGRLLQLAALFSAASVLVCWLALEFFSLAWLTIGLVIWNLVIYLLIGQAFWGMVSMLFNVRESKRLFSIVGAGDLPAKLLGYVSVSVLVPFIGVTNLLWVSVGSFIAAFALLSRYRYSADGSPGMEDAAPQPDASAPHHAGKSVIGQFFHNNLILSIAIWFLITYTILLLIDYTFLSEIKVGRTSSRELASFIAVFFAFGRLLAILFKLLFSSRVIARLGLTNSLLIAPVLLFLVNLVILLESEGMSTYLYIFGVMVLLAEVLRSTLQEPVVLVLFQPLDPHSRLKGHVIAKGNTMPFALFVAGALLAFYLRRYGELSVNFVSELLAFLLIVWAGSVFLIRKAYLHTLVGALRKGLFTGTELFLNSQSVRELLVQKTASAKPQEVIHSLDLLEQSGYPGIHDLLLRQLPNSAFEVKAYVLARIIENRVTGALPLIKAQLSGMPEARLKPLLTKAQFFLEDRDELLQRSTLQQLDPACKKAALLGLLSRPGEVHPVADQELTKMAAGEAEEKLMALAVISELAAKKYEHLVDDLLQDTEPEVYRRAIEVAGQVRYDQLFDAAAEVAERYHAYGALQKALLSFGDPVYTSAYVCKEELSEPLAELLIKTAGRIKGPHSTAFLDAALERFPAKANLVVEALWEKKASPSLVTSQVLEQWLDIRLEQGLLKRKYYLQLMADQEATLLQEALYSEIQQDIQSILKGLSLVYHQQRIDRIIELYKLGYTQKLSNAVEMLELLVPKKYFTGLDTLLEFVLDVKSKQLHRAQTRTGQTAAIIGEILNGNRAGCTSWTRSVACYLIPRLQDRDFLLSVLDEKPEQEDALFLETRRYVASMLSQV
ncbi:hypothetical protein OB13_01905 [Pontibacter sp. HJ8]